MNTENKPGAHWRRELARWRAQRVRPTGRRTDEQLAAAAAACEQSAARADARGHVGKAERYRRRAEELRAQMTANAKAWFERWAAKADELEAEARECAAAGKSHEADMCRLDAAHCREAACRFNPHAAADDFDQVRERVTLGLNQETLDALKELRVRITGGTQTLASILAEAVYALQEMRVEDRHAAAVWPVYFRFRATARQDQRPRSWARKDRHIADSARINYQLAKAEMQGCG